MLPFFTVTTAVIVEELCTTTLPTTGFAPEPLTNATETPGKNPDPVIVTGTTDPINPELGVIAATDTAGEPEPPQPDELIGTAVLSVMPGVGDSLGVTNYFYTDDTGSTDDQICGLTAGSYVVSEVIPTGYTQLGGRS